MLNKRMIKTSTTDEDLLLERAERSLSQGSRATADEGEKVALEEPEIICSDKELERKVETLSEWIKQQEGDEQHFIVFHVGGGMSSVDDLVSMERCGFVHWIVTPECNGLIRKAGFPAEKLSELHGNVFKEICPECGAEYYRDFPVRAGAVQRRDHRTGRICEDDICKGELVDNLVHFGELLNDEATAQVNSKRATISVAIGDAAAAHASEWVFMPHYNKQKPAGKVIIVNPCRTSVDSEADLVIHHKAAPFFRALVRALNIADLSNHAEDMNK